MSNDSQIFIGGVGRSGTHAIAMMLHTIPSIFILDEPRFLCVAGGFPSLLMEDISFGHLIENVATHFNHFVGSYPSELWQLPEVYTEEIIRKAFDENIPKEARLLTKCFHLFDTYTKLGMNAVNRTQWAVKEPGIVSQVPWAIKAFPKFKLVHMIREPKDTCCSVITQHWGQEGLEWAAFNYQKHIRMASQGLPNEGWVKERQIHIMSLENFIANPEISVKMLLSFLEIDIEPKLVQQLIDNVDSKKSTLGRWRNDLTTAQRHLVDGTCNSLYYQFVDYEKECFEHESKYMEDKKS